MIRFSGGPIVDTLYTSDGTKGQIIAQITSALVQAGWTGFGSGVYESAVTPNRFKIRVDVVDTIPSAVNLRIQSDAQINHGYVDGAYIKPVSGRVFRIWANKYQLYHFVSGSTVNITDPCNVAFGVPWTPPWFVPFASQPIFDQDLIAFSETSTEDCMQLVYHSWDFGPWPADTSVHLYGTVDDDIRVNGEIWDEGMFPFNSGRGVPCDGIANGLHNFDRVFDLPADTPIHIDLINNFISTASMNAHITVETPHMSRMTRGRFGPSIDHIDSRDSIGWDGHGGGGGIPPPQEGEDPWYGWMACNGMMPPGGGFNNQVGFTLHRGVFHTLGTNIGGMWMWDGVAFNDTGGGDIQRVVCQATLAQPTESFVDWSGRWVSGNVSLYEPYITWPAGHTTSGNWAQITRRGQLWDAMVYASNDIPNETVKIIDGRNWRNITVPHAPYSGLQIPHSMLLLTN